MRLVLKPEIYLRAGNVELHITLEVELNVDISVLDICFTIVNV